MNDYLKEQIASYVSWRKGTLMIAPLEILLILVVVALLVMTFFTSLTSTAGKNSMAALKNHLQALQSRLADPGTIDSEAERENMEVLINKVKGTCEQRDISGNKELKELFGQTHTKLQAMDEQQTRKRGSWLQFKGITNSFNELYFPALVKKPVYHSPDPVTTSA